MFSAFFLFYVLLYFNFILDAIVMREIFLQCKVRVKSWLAYCREVLSLRVRYKKILNSLLKKVVINLFKMDVPVMQELVFWSVL